MIRLTASVAILASLGLLAGCPIATPTWVRTFTFGGIGASGEAAFVNRDGSIIVAGRYRDAENERKSVVAKLDSHGNEIWRYLSANTSRASSHLVMPIRSGGALVALAFVDGDEHRPGFIRLNKRGELIGAKYVDHIEDYGGFSMPAPTADGGFLIGGATRITHDLILAGLLDPASTPFISKFDHRGNHQWTDSYKDFGTSAVMDITPTADGGFIAVHHAAYATPSGLPAPALNKLDREGRIVWFKQYNGYQLKSNWLPSQVLQADDGGFIIVGWTDKFDVDAKLGFIRTDAQGNLIGQNKLESESIYRGIPTAVKIPGDGFTVAVHIDDDGPFSGIPEDEDMALLHVSDDLEPLWLNRYGTDGNDFPLHVQAARGGGYVIVGVTGWPSRNTVFTVVKTDAEGNAPNLRSSTTDIDSTAF